jgi:hypothetical protein
MRTIPGAIIVVLCVSVMAHARQDRPEDRVQVRGLFGSAAFFEPRPIRPWAPSADFRLARGLRLGPEVILPHRSRPGSRHHINVAGEL